VVYNKEFIIQYAWYEHKSMTGCIGNVHSSLIYGTPHYAHFKEEKDTNNITILVMAKDMR